MRSRATGSAGRSSARKNTPLLVPPRMQTAGIRSCFMAALYTGGLHVPDRNLDAAGPATYDWPSKGSGVLGQMRLLVVEDNNDLVALMTKALARAGLDVDAAQTVADAEAS